VERTLAARTTVPTTLERVRQVLGRDREAVIGPLVSTGPDQHLSALAVGSQTITTSHEVAVTVGPAQVEDDDRVRWSLRIRPTAHEQVLPSLAGTLTATRHGSGTRLDLTGSYRAPLGAAGAFGDGVLGHRVARASADGFLSGLADRIAAAAARRAVTVRICPPPYPPDLRPSGRDLHPASG
jgi:hypothetical protein